MLPPPSPAPAPGLVVDAVVCAAADAMDLPPRHVRLGLYAALLRVKELSLSLETIEQALAASLRPSPLAPR